MWTILLVGLATTLGLSFAWLRRLATDVSLTRRRAAPGWWPGAALEEMWELVNRGALPVLAAEIVDHSTLSHVYGQPGDGGRPQRRHRVAHHRDLPAARPVHPSPPRDVIMSDPFGPTPHPTLHASQSILVYPRVVSLPPLELRGDAGGRARATRKALESDLTVHMCAPGRQATAWPRGLGRHHAP